MSGVVTVAIPPTPGGGTCVNLTMSHGELLHPNGSMWNQFYAGNGEAEWMCIAPT